MTVIIRPIAPTDNAAIEAIVKNVLEEFGCTGPGWASGDAELKTMFETYQGEGRGYWVLEDEETKEVLGGGGFARLKGTSEADHLCELQKFYFLSKVRGQGLGKQLLDKIIAKAAQSGYWEIYLESAPHLKAAVGLYERVGFEHLCSHKGNTGHQQNCSVFMSRFLDARKVSTSTEIASASGV